MTYPEKTWWTPLWRGLVVDPEGTHLRRMKTAHGLHLYLIIHADRRTGRLVRKYATIARDMGFPVRTIRAWMRRLEFYDYVRLTKTGRAMLIEVLKWRPVGRDPATPTGAGLPVRAARIGHGENGGRPGSEQPRGAGEGEPRPNKSSLTRVLQRDNGVEKFSRPDSEPERTAEDRRARAELLAQDLAAGLDDLGHLAHYRVYADRFPDSLLRRLLSDARATPAHRIKRSRAALFEYLLKQHVLSTSPSESHDSRD